MTKRQTSVKILARITEIEVQKESESTVVL